MEVVIAISGHFCASVGQFSHPFTEEVLRARQRSGDVVNAQIGARSCDTVFGDQAQSSDRWYVQIGDG